MITGFISLGGQQRPQPLPLPEGTHRIGDGQGNRTGHWEIVTSYPVFRLSIPARDKAVEAYSNNEALVSRLAHLDSDSDLPYRAKMMAAVSDLPGLEAVVKNDNFSTHGSFAIVSSQLHVYGLHDLRASVSYLFWTTEPQALQDLLGREPLRYLLYRMPLMDSCLFIQSETLCAKWWRWTRTHHLLYAFNVLERRLYHAGQEAGNG